MNTCPSCKCSSTIEGSLIREPVFFRPDGLKFFTFNTQVEVLERFQACLECGHIWSSVDKDELKELINSSGKPELKDKLNM